MKNRLKILHQGLRNINGGCMIIAILAFVLGWQIGHRDYVLSVKDYKPEFKVVNQTPPAGNPNIDFKLFWDTWTLISQKYIDKKALDPQKLYFGAIQGMVAAIGDPYTVFLPPQSQKSTKEQLGGSFEGVGLQLGYNKDKRLVVIAPLKGTPAEKAGARAGDLIISINKKDTVGISLPEAVSMIRGPKGSSVSLALLGESDTKPRDVEITRDTIIVKSVEFEAQKTKSGKTVALLKVSSFGERTRDEWNKAVSDALSKAPQVVIVDVRNNPGGFLDAAVYIASEFLNGGTVVMQEDALGQRVTQTTVREGRLLKLPLVVLINKGSASASEILAGAMQDRQRGKLVGDQSFGKGTIQSAEDLTENTGIHITTSKWLTPDGHWVHNVGLTPDVKVELPEIKNSDNQEKFSDIQLEKALEVLDQQ